MMSPYHSSRGPKRRFRHRSRIRKGISIARAISLVLAANWLIAGMPTRAAAQTLSMKEFLARKPQWRQLEKSDKTLHIEGRLNIISGANFRLEKCPLLFKAPREEMTRFDPGTKRLRIACRLDHRGETQFFRVISIEELPSDQERYVIRRAAINPAKASDWYELAQWARPKGLFYNDKFLLKKADEAQHNGLLAERRAAAGDRETLLSLAKKAEAAGQSTIAREIHHEALRLRWRTLQPDQEGKDKEPETLSPEEREKQIKTLLAAIRKKLPGADQPVPKPQPTLVAAYADQPIATYNRSSSEEYDTLDRLFLAEVLLARIERNADSSGANGEKIADRIEAVLPERQTLAEHYRRREIRYRLDHLERASRDEVLHLAKQLEQRDRPQNARQAVAHWLEFREEAARQSGPSELASVAEDYLALLDDRSTATKLLLEAAKAAPESEYIRQDLEQLGYRRMDGKWLSPEEFAARPVDPIVAAMHAGRVVAGMSPQQVQATLGKPTTLARSAGRTQIHIVWTYGVTSGLVVHFVRGTGEKPATARVINLATWRRPLAK